MYVTYPHPVDKEIKQNFFEEVDKKVLVLAELLSSSVYDSTFVENLTKNLFSFCNAKGLY